MQIKILETYDNSLLENIRHSLSWSDSVYFGVSYANNNAFLKLKNEFIDFLRKNGKLRVLVDIERFMTDKTIIEEFATIPGDSECKVFFKFPDDNIKGNIGYYHPKFYLFFDEDKFNVIIGSSNLTLGGITKNIECNLCVSGSKKEDLFQETIDFFYKIWDSKFSLNILDHSDLLDAYESFYKEKIRQDTLKQRKLTKFRERLDSKAELILKTKREILNEDFSYLLGLISANSEIDFKKNRLVIDLYRGVANKGKEYQGYYFNPEISEYKISQYDAHRKDVDRIKEKLSGLFKNLETRDKISIKHIKEYRFKILLEFDDDSIIFNELKKYNIAQKKTKTIPFVPKSILDSNNRKLIISFLRGYCDLKSRISTSDGIYKTINGRKVFSLLRMGISVPHNYPGLLEFFHTLFDKVGIKNVSYSDPRKRKIREYLIRIDVRQVPYELLGTHWRRIFLRDFVDYIKKQKSKTR